MVRAACSVLIALTVAGCSSRERIVVGSKNFTEQVVLGELIAQQLERAAGIEVDRKLNLGGTLLAHEALKGGSIDLYPEYTGTALTAVLQSPVTSDRRAVLAQVREGYRKWGLEWMDPLGFDNTFAMVVRTDTAQRDRLRTLSDAAARGAPWRIGVGYEFVQRPDGLQGLMQAYRLRLADKPATMDLGLLYPALESNRIDLAAASATDGQLARPGFRVLADDLAYFPPYECAIVAREEMLRRNPRVKTALELLSGRISDRDMRRMNAAVDLERRPVAEVVREFLERAGK